MRFKIPGIRTKEGLQISGSYGLAGVLLISALLPALDLDQVAAILQQVIGLLQDLLGVLQQANVTAGEAVGGSSKLTAAIYILLKQRE